MKNLKSMAFHPLFVYFVVAILSCLPKYDNVEVLNEMPKVGDNFKTKNDASIFFYNGNGKFSYPSPECYFKLGNPPFVTHWKEGGIKIIEESIVNQIPTIGWMCDSSLAKKVKVKHVKVPLSTYISKDYLLSNFSELAHFACYMLLAISIILKFQYSKNKYLFAFAGCLLGGILLEFIQHFFIPGRHASYEDVILNTLGSVLGIIIYLVYKKIASIYFKTEAK